MKNLLIFTFILSIFALSSCKKDVINPEDEGPFLIMYFDIDSTMERLDNFGVPVDIPAGNAAQNPLMNFIAAHYIEFTPNALTQLGDGEVIYNSPNTYIGGDRALIFDSVSQVKDGEVFYKIPLKNITPGTYEYLRVSIAYENYDIMYHVDTVINGMQIEKDEVGTIANFVGYNNYITNYTIKNKTVTVNGNKKQGYFGFESLFSYMGFEFPILKTGDVPEGGTTVPNVISGTSPIPTGSCIITGNFDGGPFKLTGKETKDIKIKVKVSTNGGFEWKDTNGNGKYDPLKGEAPVDMGVRGIRGVVE